MRPRLLITAGLAIVAGALVSCSDREVAAPEDQTPSLARPAPEPDCDTHKEECEVTGRMTGGGGTLTVGNVLITKGMTIHCDILLSNNLEINWPDNKWHLDKPITSADCIDDPAISPEPPPAPFDTFRGTAIGRLNGVDGSYIDFIFVDSGEPGGSNDKVQLLILTPGGDVALNVPLTFLDRGNLQAHYDQPHR